MTKMRCLRQTIVVSAILFAVGCSVGRGPTDTSSASTSDLSQADIGAIRATSDRWFAAVREQRWDDAAATFTEDAILWIGTATYQGRPAIRNFLQSMPPFDPTRKLIIDEIRGHGDMAFVSGHSTVTPEGGGAPIVVGRYLDVRVRQNDGTWRFSRDMVIPIPPPASPTSR